MEWTGEQITSGRFWQAVGARPVGATIVTTQTADGPAGFLGLSFAHVSAEPPTVLVSAGHRTGALPAILTSKAFAISLLPPDMEELARAFGGSVGGENRFGGQSWDHLVTGAPVLSCAAAAFDCRLQATLEDEGAVVILGRVVGLRVPDAAGVTIAYRGGYRNL